MLFTELIDRSNLYSNLNSCSADWHHGIILEIYESEIEF